MSSGRSAWCARVSASRAAILSRPRRRRVVAATLATFVLAWGMIAWQGSLGTEGKTASAQVREVSATATATSSDLTTSQS